MTYAIKKAFKALGKIAKENPNAAGEVLAEIARKHGGITPALVVDESAAPDAPLHAYFEWDDSIAGRHWREQQAAYLIRAVVTTLPETNDVVRAFVHVADPEANESGSHAGEYKPIQEVLADEELREQMLARALADLRAWEERFAVLSELAPVRRAAKELYKKHDAAGEARPGKVWSGGAGSGQARTGKAGADWQGPAGPGSAGQGPAGEARHGAVGNGKAGEAARGRAKPGMARQACQGSARKGRASIGEAGTACQGVAGHGTARQARKKAAGGRQ